MNPSQHISLRILTERDLRTAQEVFEATPAYHKLVNGKPAEPDIARRCFDKEPPKPKKGIRTYKRLLGIERDNGGLRPEMLGLIDVFVGYPAYHIATIGTLLLRESLHRKGLGTRAVKLLKDWMFQHHPAIEWLDCSVTDDNIPATRFLISVGFERTNSWHEIEVDGRTRRVIRLEQRIKAAPG